MATEPIATTEATASTKQSILTPFRLGSLNLPNRVVMSPMTRGRTESLERVPGPLEADYYAQRASAGLIISGGTYVSAQAVGGIRVPGIYTEGQVEGWKRVTDAVHSSGGRIVLQLGHSGSISHPDLLDGALPVSASAVDPQQKVFTPTGFKDTLVPRALELDEIHHIVSDFGKAAKNAKAAGFDGVELHAANVYLLAQFLNGTFNHRKDSYGGSSEGRIRVVMEVLAAMAAHWSKDTMGIKLSPGLNGFGALQANETTLPTYDYLIGELDRFAIGYIHLMRPINDVSQSSVAVLQEGTYKRYRPLFKGTLIANFGFDQDSASEIVNDGDADLVSFARSYIANPDLPERFAQNAPLAEGDRETFYQGGAMGYTSYSRHI